MAAYQVIGQPVPRTDGPEKVSGGALYTADVALPGTLWGKTLHSPHPHALIVRIDTARAAQLPGVHAVLTGADVVGMRYGYRIKDTPLLAHDRVRFAGERVAAVAAIDHDIAQRALELIEVEYEDLPAVFEPLEALAEGAPLLHPDMNSYVGLPEPLEKPSNAFVHQVWRSGDVVEGFARSDVIVEHTYTTPMIHQAYLEPNSCLVRIDEKRRVQVWASSKAPYGLKRNLAAAVGIPEEHIVLNHVHIGGDFGAKGLTLDAPICFLLAQRTGRPVKIVMDFVEEFTAANPRHATVMRLKTGVKRDGTLVAHQSEVFFNSGAYGSRMPGGFLHGGGRAGGPYRIPHVPHGVTPSIHQHGSLRIYASPRGASGLLRHRVPYGQHRSAVRHGPSGVPHEEPHR